MVAEIPGKHPSQSRAEKALSQDIATDTSAQPSRAQIAYLKRGLDQPGGKLPLFDRNGQEVAARTVRACLASGWAEPWFSNPLKPDWLVCRLTDAGRRVLRND